MHTLRRLFLAIAEGGLAGGSMLTLVMVTLRWSHDAGRFWRIVGAVRARPPFSRLWPRASDTDRPANGDRYGHVRAPASGLGAPDQE